jgi:hypothetical protein
MIADHQRRRIRDRRREVVVEQKDLELASVAIAPDAEVDRVVCDCLYKLLLTLKPEYADVIWRADILGEPRERIAASRNDPKQGVGDSVFRVFVSGRFVVEATVTAVE